MIQIYITTIKNIKSAKELSQCLAEQKAII